MRHILTFVSGDDIGQGDLSTIVRILERAGLNIERELHLVRMAYLRIARRARGTSAAPLAQSSLSVRSVDDSLSERAHGVRRTMHGQLPAPCDAAPCDAMV